MFKELISLFQKDNLLKQSYDDCVEMLTTDHEMFLESIRSLRESDNSKIAFDIYEKDKLINAFEREVRRNVLTHLSISGPAQLPMGLRLVSIVIDIERIGDYTKNIVELAQHHPERLCAGSFEPTVQKLESVAKENFKNMLEIFKNQDEVGAREIMRSHQTEVASVADDIINGMIRGEIGDLHCREAVALGIYVRYLKRAHSHLKNIASSIVNPLDRIGYVE